MMEADHSAGSQVFMAVWLYGALTCSYRTSAFPAISLGLSCDFRSSQSLRLIICCVVSFRFHRIVFCALCQFLLFVALSFPITANADQAARVQWLQQAMPTLKLLYLCT